MIKAVQEVGAVISQAKPITESADAVSSYTENFLKQVRAYFAATCDSVSRIVASLLFHVRLSPFLTYHTLAHTP